MRGLRVLALFMVAAVLGSGLVAVPAQAAPDAPDALTFAGDRVPADTWRARQDEYLAWAAAQPLRPGDPMSIMAHAEHAERTGGTWDSGAPSVDDFAGTFQALRDFKDTNDFRVNSLLQMMVQYGDELDPDLYDATLERILAFKYWYDEPTPEGIVDSQYYWTENHLIIYLADELIAGEQWPDRVFTNSGMTGAEHADHARPLILRWLALRARYGFSEWLSNVYWMEDFMAMILLADLAQDQDIADRSAQMLDSMFVELASHIQQGAFGSTHGRSYNKDKMTARDEDTFTLAQMVFDDNDLPYQRLDRVTQLAVASRYVPPEVARQIAADDRPSLVEQRQSLPIDPTAPITDDPVGPDGLRYDDEFVWWSLGGQFPWQVVPRSIELIRDLELLDTDNFQQVSELRPVIESSTVPQLQTIAQQLALALNPGLLSDVRTTTWREQNVMLSSAQGFRPGARSEQGHFSQATVDADAQVFHTHPSDPVPTGTTDWYQDTGYWTGSASVPWTVQHENVNLAIYSPGYTPPVPSLGYEPYTHAYFPTDRFDEVVQEAGWTIGRKGDGYVALWSYRPAEFVTRDPATTPTQGMTGPFDLVANGGPENVWIMEVGGVDGPNGTSFGAFVDSVTSAEVEVDKLDRGYSVRYRSPSQGLLSTSWEQPLSVEGDVQPLGTDAKWSSPWATEPWGSMCATVTAGGATLQLDFSDLRPLLTDPDAAPEPGPCVVRSTETTTTTSTPSTPSTPTTTPPAPPSPDPTPAQPVSGSPAYTG